MTSARDALEWMTAKANAKTKDGGKRFLFRGQNNVWPTIKPSITRLDEQTMIDMWAICQWFSAAAHGVTGYHIPNQHDRLAILQHYIVRSPVIDLTATPEVALYFALQAAEPPRKCVVYSIDRDKASSAAVVFSDHSFLALPLDAGGRKHRWLRQDGYSVGPKACCNLDIVQEFDFLSLPGVEHICFVPSCGDENLISHLGDLEDTEADPLARAVRGAVTCIARGLTRLTPGIDAILRASRTIDPLAMLAEEIDGLISLASAAQAPRSVLDTLTRLRAHVKTGWDTSLECSLDWARNQVQQLIHVSDSSKQKRSTLRRRKKVSKPSHYQ